MWAKNVGELIWQENEAENNFFFLIFSEYRKKFQNVDFNLFGNVFWWFHDYL